MLSSNAEDQETGLLREDLFRCFDDTVRCLTELFKGNLDSSIYFPLNFT